MTDKEKYETAVHELGHYIVARALGIAAHFVSIRVGLQTLGITFSTEDAKARAMRTSRREIAFFREDGKPNALRNFAEHGKSGDIEHGEQRRGISSSAFSANARSSGGTASFLRTVGLTKDVGGSFLESRDARPRSRTIPAAVLLAEERRARKILRFFGKSLLQKIARILAERSSGVMLRKELDALLQPKLVEYHRQNNIVDRIRKSVV